MSDDVSRGMKETAEQVGKKARQEFSEEASEQLAKHSDDVAKGVKETAEQAGKKVSQEFGQEASEQLAKHGDEVAKGLEETAEQAHPEAHWEGHRWESNLEELHEKMLANNVPINSEVHSIEEIAKQQAEILKVRDGEEALSSSLKKGNFGEMVQDEYYRQFGYERISKDMVTGLDDVGRRGIDGVYYNPNGNPPYIIAEAKYNTSRLSKGLADGTDQMDFEWIDKRLDKAVSEEHSLAIRKSLLKPDSNVQSHLFNIKQDGDIIVSQLDEMAKKMK